MAPTRNELMDSNEVDGIIGIAQKAANVAKSLSDKSEFNNQWLIEDGNYRRPFQMLPPNFRMLSWFTYLKEHFVEGLDHKDWFIRLKCCLFLPLALKYKAFSYVKDTGPFKIIQVNIILRPVLCLSHTPFKKKMPPLVHEP